MSKLFRLLYVVETLSTYVFYVMRGKAEKATNYIFERFLKLGGLYVKFLQLLAVRDGVQDIKFANMTDVLAVFDKVEYERIDIQSTLKKELGLLSTEITNVSTQPVAAGSFGQVYAGTLATGEQIVVKILRPSVQENLDFDLGLLSFAVRIMSWFRPNDMIDAKTAFQDLRELTINETDYSHEEKNATRVYEDLKDNQTIVIPKTYSHLSTSTVLVQEKIDGLPLTTLLMQEGHKQEYVKQLLGTDLDFVLEELAYETLHANLSGRISHGDPHPGNVYILSGNRIALIDFGIENKPIIRRKDLLNLISSYVEIYDGVFDPEKLTEKMMSFFVPELLLSLNIVGHSAGINLRRKVVDVLGDLAKISLEDGPNRFYAQELLNEYKMLNLFTDVINQNNRFGIKADIESMALMRSSSIYINVIKKLGRDIHIISRAYKRILRAHGNEHQVSTVSYDTESLDRSFHTVSNWLDRLRYSDPISYIKLSEAIQ